MKSFFDHEVYYIQAEQPLSFGKVALISVGVAIVIWGLFVAFDLMFVVPADVRSEVVDLIVK